MMPRDDIEALQEEVKELKETLGITMELARNNFDLYKITQEDCQILAKKLLDAKPELEDWVKLNFGEYL